jgi:hypothetical protein
VSTKQSARRQLPIVLSATALAIAMFGSTPVGHAVGSRVSPFAAHAKKADYAANAGALSGIKASRLPKAGQLVPLGQNGKFPASVGLGGSAGTQGPKGDKGEPGAPGPAGPKGANGAKGATGPVGPPGVAGDRGPAGPPGPSGIGGWQYLSKELIVGSDRPGTWQVYCPNGKRALGGGVSPLYPAAALEHVLESAPTDGGTGWEAVVWNDSGSSTDWFVWVICAYVTS